MTQLELFQGKKCALCGQFFAPDPRVGERQKCCRAPECRKKRKTMQDKLWRRKNPEYFRGRYEYVKAWREAHPGYQKARRCKLRLGEIQAQMLRVTQVGQAFWVDGATTQAA